MNEIMRIWPHATSSLSLFRRWTWTATASCPWRSSCRRARATRPCARASAHSPTSSSEEGAQWLSPWSVDFRAEKQLRRNSDCVRGEASYLCDMIIRDYSAAQSGKRKRGPCATCSVECDAASILPNSETDINVAVHRRCCCSKVYTPVQRP